MKLSAASLYNISYNLKLNHYVKISAEDCVLTGPFTGPRDMCINYFNTLHNDIYHRVISSMPR